MGVKGLVGREWEQGAARRRAYGPLSFVGEWLLGEVHEAVVGIDKRLSWIPLFTHMYIKINRTVVTCDQLCEEALNGRLCG